MTTSASPTASTISSLLFTTVKDPSTLQAAFSKDRQKYPKYAFHPADSKQHSMHTCPVGIVLTLFNTLCDHCASGVQVPAVWRGDDHQQDH